MKKILITINGLLIASMFASSANLSAMKNSENPVQTRELSQSMEQHYVMPQCESVRHLRQCQLWCKAPRKKFFETLEKYEWYGKDHGMLVILPNIVWAFVLRLGRSFACHARQNEVLNFSEQIANSVICAHRMIEMHYNECSACPIIDIEAMYARTNWMVAVKKRLFDEFLSPSSSMFHAGMNLFDVVTVSDTSNNIADVMQYNFSDVIQACILHNKFSTDHWSQIDYCFHSDGF